MKKLLTILFLSVSLSSFSRILYKSFPVDGHMIISPEDGYLPGDTVYIRKGVDILFANTDNMSIYMFNISGAPGRPIFFMWDPLESPLIDNSTWNGGAWADGLDIINCQRIVFKGTPSAPIVIKCGTNNANRQNILNVSLNNFSYKIELAYLQIYDGGTGVQMKTEGTSDSLTWYGRTYMDSNYFHHIGIHNSGNEGFYIGPTSMFIKVAGTDSVGYVQQNNFCSDALPDTVTNALSRGFYKRVNMYHKITLHDCTVDTSGADAFQFASIDSLTVYNVTGRDWAFGNAAGHKGGLLFGGYCINTYAHDFVLKHSDNGAGIWEFGEGTQHLYYNGLIDSVGSEPVFIKQGKPGVCGFNSTVTFDHLTITRAKYTPMFRASPNMGAVDSITVYNNLSTDLGNDPGFGTIIYFYTEGGSTPKYKVAAGANQNLTYSTYTAAGIDANNYMQPLSGSPVGDEGYRRTATLVFHRIKRLAQGSFIKRKLN